MPVQHDVVDRLHSYGPHRISMLCPHRLPELIRVGTHTLEGTSSRAGVEIERGDQKVFCASASRPISFS
jgi:hypothetical protein